MKVEKFVSKMSAKFPNVWVEQKPRTIILHDKEESSESSIIKCESDNLSVISQIVMEEIISDYDTYGSLS